MHAVHTAGVPPNQGRAKRPINGCSPKRRKALVKRVKA
jgi:hypothetical protein